MTRRGAPRPQASHGERYASGKERRLQAAASNGEGYVSSKRGKNEDA